MTLWRCERPLVLASKSEIRRIVLQNAGIPVDVKPADIDERAVERAAETPDPSAIAALLAREKACAVAANDSSQLVLGADQTLALGDLRFSKPADRDVARKQLLALRGKTHALHSGIALVQGGRVLFEHCGIARLTMRDFSEEFLEAYLDAAGPAAMSSVGAYQLEGIGITLFERIEGDHFTILGLPIFPLLAELRRMGALAA